MLLRNSDYLFECIDSIIDKECAFCFDYEIVICDQSDDKVHSLIESEIAKKYFNFPVSLKYLKEKNVSKARHLLIQNCKYDYCCFVDSDDYLDKKYIEKIIALLDKEHAPDMIVFNYLQVDDRGVFYKNNLNVTEEQFLDYFYYTSSFNSVCMKCFKRTLYNPHDYSNYSNKNGEDFIMSLPLVKKASRIVVKSDMYIYYYRKHDSSRVKNVDYKDCEYLLLSHREGVDYNNLSFLQKRLRTDYLLTTLSNFSYKLLHGLKKVTRQQMIDLFKKARFVFKKEKLNIKNCYGLKQRIMYVLLLLKMYNILYGLYKHKTKY